MRPFRWLVLEEDHVAVDELVEFLVKLTDHLTDLLIETTEAFGRILSNALLTIRELFLHQIHMATCSCFSGLPASGYLAVA